MNQHKNNPKYKYEIVIAPDPTNDTMTPMEIVEGFLNNPTSTNLFKTYLPDWDDNAEVDYKELRAVKPRMRRQP